MCPPVDQAGRWNSPYHAPVLIEEVVRLLSNARNVLDGTLGGGGHSAALLEQSATVTVTGIDRDPEALATARERLAAHEAAGRFRGYTGNFAALDPIVPLRGVSF